ncbi:MAG: Ig-like domain-containing protein [Elusimicrobiota bacterium]|nr:MAG: Ig-like domain-containing protein [Elusimicrobiota bacterium]
MLNACASSPCSRSSSPPRAQEAPPALGDVSAEIFASSAVVTWGTDRPAVGQAEWGETEAYGITTPLETQPSSSHSASLNGLARGRTYHYRVRARTAAGEAVSSDYTIGVPSEPGAPPPGADSKAPSAVIMTPSAGPPVAGVVAVSANATDDVGVATVQFLLDGAALGPALSSSPYTFLWNTAEFGDGSHALAASVRDAAGNAATSPVVRVTLANSVASSTAAHAASASAHAASDAAARAPQKLLSPRASTASTTPPSSGPRPPR